MPLRRLGGAPFARRLAERSSRERERTTATRSRRPSFCRARTISLSLRGRSHRSPTRGRLPREDPYCIMQVDTCMIGTVDVSEEKVFKALADPTRRYLLDRLRQKDGQTLGELCEHLEMARQSASQHLDVLEGANLVTTLQRGREKLHCRAPPGPPRRSLPRRRDVGQPRKYATGTRHRPGGGRPVAGTAAPTPRRWDQERTECPLCEVVGVADNSSRLEGRLGIVEPRPGGGHAADQGAFQRRGESG